MCISKYAEIPMKFNHETRKVYANSKFNAIRSRKDSLMKQSKSIPEKIQNVSKYQSEDENVVLLGGFKEVRGWD